MSSNKPLDLSIIIPFKDKAAMTIDCLDSLHTYGESVKEILLISNNSSEQEVTHVKKAAEKYKNTRVVVYDHPFNFQAINNWGVSKTSGKVVMLLNNDIELDENSAGLLKAMYNKALEKNVGAVGCVLLYEDRSTVQHAGVYLIPGGTADHVYIGKKFSYAKSGNPLNINEGLQLSAVTAAAVMIERQKFDTINGMNEDFIICGGDVDMCLRLHEQGYKSWLVGANHGYMIHKESKSRSMIAVPYVDFVESYKSYVRHFDPITGDPFVSPEVMAHV